jgi:hypothetical protein
LTDAFAFPAILRDVRKLRDWMVEKSGFELPVPGEMSEIAALERLHAI